MGTLCAPCLSDRGTAPTCCTPKRRASNVFGSHAAHARPTTPYLLCFCKFHNGIALDHSMSKSHPDACAWGKHRGQARTERVDTFRPGSGTPPWFPDSGTAPYTLGGSPLLITDSLQQRAHTAPCKHQPTYFNYFHDIPAIAYAPAPCAHGHLPTATVPIHSSFGIRRTNGRPVCPPSCLRTSTIILLAML